MVISSLILILFLLPVSAVRISEVELNPEGSDSGNEWVELYSDSEEILEGYYLENEDGNILNLSGSMTGYYIISLEKQWLDNSDAVIYLKDSSSTIHQTSLLSDSKNNDLTWSLCNNEFVFLASSKGSENQCSAQISEDREDIEAEKSNDTDNSDNEENIEDEESENEENMPKQVPIKEDNKTNVLGSIYKIEENEKIILNTQASQSSSNVLYSKEEKVRIYISLSFTLLCILIIILLAMRRL